MGSTAAFAGAGGRNGLRGCAGVAKAGEDEKMALDGGPRFLGAKNGGGGGFARLAPFSGGFCWFFRGVFLGLCIAIILAVPVLNGRLVVAMRYLAGPNPRVAKSALMGFSVARLGAFCLRGTTGVPSVADRQLELNLELPQAT